MALTGSGQLKFSEMRDEFGGSGQVKFLTYTGAAHWFVQPVK